MVKRGALGSRIDPFYHKQYFYNLRNSFTTKGFIFVKSLIKSWNRGDGPRDGFYTDNHDNGVFFLRVNNLKENSIDLTDVKFITRYVHERTLKRSQVTAGDLIFAISGTKDNLGTVSIIPENITSANLNSALVRLDLNLQMIDKWYFCLLFSLNFVRTQIDFIGKGAAQNNMNNEEICQIQIPLPSLLEQSEIVEMFNQAYAEKRQKEAEAKELLASIDAYLLEQLGIVLPDKIEEKNVFYVSFSKMQGSRFDSFYHKDEFEINNDAVLKGRFKVETIKEICKNLIKGRLPKDSEKDGSCKVVQINSVKIDGSIDLDDLLTAKPIFTQNQLLQENDVLIVITGATIGKISFWKYEGEYYLGGDIVKFQCNEGINPYYIYSYLRTQIIQTEIKRNITGATNGHLSPSDINNFQIPLPPLEIQNDIANHIRNIRERAKTLQTEAKELIEKAKAEVEKMILGE